MKLKASKRPLRSYNGKIRIFLWEKPFTIPEAIVADDMHYWARKMPAPALPCEPTTVPLRIKSISALHVLAHHTLSLTRSIINP